MDHSTKQTKPGTRRHTSAGVLLTSIAFLVAGSVASAADSAGQSAGDCTEIDLRFESFDEPLTDAEISELRRQRHEASLNAFERCVTAASGGAAGGNGSGGNGAGAGVAASGISGTNPNPTNVELPSAEEAAQDELEQTAEVETPPQSQEANGRAPQDIPPADNDSVLAAQIRRAAESESDPERRALLWNEYRKIRGLPTVDS